MTKIDNQYLLVSYLPIIPLSDYLVLQSGLRGELAQWLH